MSQYNFGVGTIIGVREDITYAMPSFLGVCQDIEVDFDRTIKELMGQYQFAVAIAASQVKISGKSKFARIQMSTMNNLFLGQTQNTGTQTLMPAQGEAHNIPASGPYTITATNSGTFVTDLGVAYAATGKVLQPVASGPTTGQYSVSAGTYTFAAADEGLGVLLYYSYTASTGFNMTIANQLAGVQPTFSLNMQQQFNQLGGVKTLYLTLNACVSSKLTLPFKNQDFTTMELDFQAFADSNGNIGTLSTSE